MPAVKTAFKARYKTPDTVMYQNATQLFSKRQDAGLSSEDYIAIMRKLGSEIGADDRMIRFAILNGLRPELRGFVIQKQPENFDQLVEAARLAELSSSPLRGADTSAVLMDQIADMRTQLKEASAKWDKLLSAPVDTQSTPEQFQSALPSDNYLLLQSSRLVVSLVVFFKSSVHATYIV